MKEQDVQGRPCVLKFWSADALPVDVGIIAFAFDRKQFEKIHRHVHH